MNDRELDNLLKKVKVPERSPQYEAKFPKRVIRALKRRTTQKQLQPSKRPKSRSK